MKQFHLCVASVVCGVVGCAQAEVVTGEISGLRNLIGIPIGLDFVGWGHNEVSYSDLVWTVDSYPASPMFVDSITGSDLMVGDYVTSSGARSGVTYWGSSEYWKDEVYNDYIGTVGESFYLGFTFVDDSNPEDVIRNFGFIQILKLSENEFDWIGYAYETQDAVSIEVYDLIPAPSGIAAFGLAGLCLTRRRRG